MSQLDTSRPPASPRSAFLSHASADAELAQQLCERLESQGVRCWIAPRDLTPGNPYSSEIVHGIEGSDALILLATATAVTSHNVLNELEQAHRLHKTLLTVMIGKPEISRQLSYYIARLHWIEAAAPSMESVAARLAQTLHGVSPWEKVASKPSIARSLEYGLWRFFVAPALATAAVILLAGFGALHYLRGKVDTDYRSLGWVTLDAARGNANTPFQIGARVWMGNQETSARAIALQGAVRTQNQPAESLDLTAKLHPDQGANGQGLTFDVPENANSIVTCLTVPGAQTGAKYRVTQSFLLQPGNGPDEAAIVPVGAARVSKEDGSLCGTQ